MMWEEVARFDTVVLPGFAHPVDLVAQVREVESGDDEVRVVAESPDGRVAQTLMQGRLKL